jgi:hypothetical protein
MFKDRDKLYQVYHTILSMALTWALTIAINEYYVLKVHVFICALFALVPAVLIYLFDMNRKNAVSYLILASFLPVAGVFFWIRWMNPITWISSVIDWFHKYDGTQELYKASPAHFTVLGVAIAGAVFFYLLVKSRFLKLSLAVALFGMLILFCIWKINLHKIVVGVCIFYMLTNLVELSGRIYSRKTGRPEKKTGILYLAPICLLLAVITVWLPSKPEPIQWKGVKLIYNNIKNKIENIITDLDFYIGNGPGEFGLAMSGFSDNGSGFLGSGSLKQDDKIALVVSDFASSSPAYLIGSVNDVYTGNSWEKSNQGYLEGEKDYNLDYAELLLALSRVDKDTLENNRFIERRLIRIEYNSIRTKSFFYPNKSSWYKFYSRTKQPLAEKATITFPKAVGNGTNYQCIYYELNYDGEKFKQMLRDADKFSYVSGQLDKEMLEYLEYSFFRHSSAPSITDRYDIFDVLAERAENIKKYYTVLPDTLPQRVRDLAVDITKDADTTYDKLKAIETYLLTYEYKLKPGRLPEGEDFVDYFLFENKKGYCTSFATSMAILARCIGIPTRYVEGYVVDSGDRKGNNYEVRNRKAHSWAEAYIEGVGWISFEATPPFYSSRYVKWREYSKDSERVDYDYLRQHMPEMNMTPPPLMGPTTIHKKDRMPVPIIGVIVVISTIVILLLFFIIYYLVLKQNYKKDFERADYTRRMYLLFLRILAILKKEGYTLDATDTLLMLAERLKDHYHYDRVIFADVAQVFMRYRYAEEEITEGELRKVDIFYHGLQDKQREETGRLKMLLQEFVFLAKKINR